VSLETPASGGANLATLPTCAAAYFWNQHFDGARNAVQRNRFEATWLTDTRPARRGQRHQPCAGRPRLGLNKPLDQLFFVKLRVIESEKSGRLSADEQALEELPENFCIDAYRSSSGVFFGRLAGASLPAQRDHVCAHLDLLSISRSYSGNFLKGWAIPFRKRGAETNLAHSGRKLMQS
jgi:hypothetical protein